MDTKDFDVQHGPTPSQSTGKRLEYRFNTGSFVTSSRQFNSGSSPESEESITNENSQCSLQDYSFIGGADITRKLFALQNTVEYL